MKRFLLIVAGVSLLSTNVMAHQSVAVIPIGGKIKAGDTIEGNNTSHILRLENDGTGYALYGYTAGTSSAYSAIRGYSAGAADGTSGRSLSGDGVYANSGSGRGVYSTSSSGYAVYGVSSSNHGIYGHTGSTSHAGVVGAQSGHSYSDLTAGYWDPGGFFAGENGVIGLTKTNSGYAVFGWNKASSSGYAGRFLADAGHGVYISSPSGTTGLLVSGGTKNAVVATDDGARLMYTEESTEVWFTDYGFATLENGSVEVQFDPIFTETVNLEKPYHVFVQPYGSASLYVTDRTSEGFTVHSSDGAGDVEFSYRVVALRLGHEHRRMERAPDADNDPHLFPGNNNARLQPEQGKREMPRSDPEPVAVNAKMGDPQE